MENNQLSTLVRTLQIIAGVMISGIAGFAIVTLAIVNWNQVNAELTPLGLVALVVALISCVAAFLVPKLVFKQAVNQYANTHPKSELHSLLRASGQAVMTSSFIGVALTEGGALCALLLWNVSGNLLGLIGAFFCLATAILKFPTYGKMEQRLADFREEVKLLKRDR